MDGFNMEIPQEPPPTNGFIEEPGEVVENGENAADKPPLGRNASTGDSQPQLSPRQETTGAVVPSEENGTTNGGVASSPGEIIEERVETFLPHPSPPPPPPVFEEPITVAPPLEAVAPPAPIDEEPKPKEEPIMEVEPIPEEVPKTVAEPMPEAESKMEVDPEPAQQAPAPEPVVEEPKMEVDPSPVKEEFKPVEEDLKKTEESMPVEEEPKAEEAEPKPEESKPEEEEPKLSSDDPPAPTNGSEKAEEATEVKESPSEAETKPTPPIQAPPMNPSEPPVAAAPPPQATAPQAGGGMRELRVEDALLYLDDVKREFGDRPMVYNEFLSIMKNFKSQEVDTPGVIAKVSKLFRGNNDLILGFNKFLPDGYKISLEDLQNQDAQYARENEARHRAGQMPPQMAPGGFARPPAMPPGAPPRASPPQAGIPGHPTIKYPPGPPGLGAVQQNLPQPPRKPMAAPPQHRLPQGLPKAQPSPPSQPQQQQQPHQAVEFDHAISYVTTIKRRFAGDPSTYHSFLEILHTYQKEQKGIKEVLEQVARLFQDHPDLLKEFTFFLPDAVQEQAKERLNRAAADSEARLSAQRAMQGRGARPMDVDGRATKLIDMTGKKGKEKGRKRSHGDTKSSSVQVAMPQQPEFYVYNSAVERQFFDAAREALASYTRDGGQAWAEFLKCLDMYAQEILSRTEMLNFVEPLLGKRNTKLFEEFKRILGAAGSASGPFPSMEDSWHSVPLSEIDFSRCRRCSPSYRALPRDYPLPPCSERSDEEAKVLNNIWVSLPVGSEESYTFRHMRRNTYEETLFRCEDERFEIDMVIDSNACTLARLEPIAEEIAQLAENELVEDGASLKPAPGESGMGGKRYQYTFDPSILGVIHRNSIARIYGDSGQEMLDLIVKNPTVAIPVVVQRLRQKDQEWKIVRDRMNRMWRDLAEQNYYKSLDHRSLTWRTTDKRAISTRTLIAEIKDRAVNGGKEGQAAILSRLEKAKEEHGSFYQITMKSALTNDLDLTLLPKPDRRLFTPHLSLLYENNNWVHRDAYRILFFAVERGNISPTDKERIHRLWSEFLGPWFNLSLNWMLSPAAAYQEKNAITATEMTKVVSEENSIAEGEQQSPEDIEMMDDVVVKDLDKNALSFSEHHPLPSGATVSTLYGEGHIIKFRKSDSSYLVQLEFGKAYLQPNAVLCSILGAEKSAYTTQLRDSDKSKLQRPDDMLAIGTQSLYLFFRLHHILVTRLGVAKELAYSVNDDISLQSMVEQIPGDDSTALGRKRYDAYLGLLCNLLDSGGSAAEGGKYEDRVRSLLGHGGYALATMDKLVSHIIKNLQSMVNDDTMWNLIQLFRRHMDAGSFKPDAFRQEAAFLSDGETMYAFQKCPVHKDRGDKCVLHFEHLGVISESEAEDGSPPEATEPPPMKRPRRDR